MLNLLFLSNLRDKTKLKSTAKAQDYRKKISGTFRVLWENYFEKF